MRTLFSILLHISIAIACGGLEIAHADEVDDAISQQMREKRIPGLSLAIIADGKVVRAHGYGLADEARNIPVTTETLFQAGSISKPVAAAGVLRLVEQHKLDLDEDVNSKLRTWNVPASEFTKAEKVTLRRILCHGAGLTVHGFPGYSVTSRIPTLPQVLDGASPANTDAVRVDITPGSRHRYSGGGYTVLQQLVCDVTNKQFPAIMDETVLAPVGMKNSTYQQPLPRAKERIAATGYLPKGKAVEGRWHVYPEMAAAGLWTTASDLARFAIAIQHAYAGDSNAVLSKAMAHEMLTRQIGDFGLGVMLLGNEGQETLMGKERTLIFCHGGRDEGFDANLAATATTGKGAVILINKNAEEGAFEAIMKVIAKKYEWP
jgi:CubicO group peptidase (beta-lactamase class C family)